MTTNNEQNIPQKPLATIGKFVILFIGILLGLVCILPYFDLTYILSAIFAILALVVSVVLFTKQTHFKIYALPALITSLFFSASCLLVVYNTYSDVTPLHTKTSLNLIGLGLFMIGVGFLTATVSVAMSVMNKVNFWKSNYSIEFKYPKYSMIMFFLIGAVMIATGLFTVVNSLKNLSLV